MRVFAALRAAQHRELTLTQIFLVGTAHVSKASVEEVRSTIRRVRPATVLVELDAGRAQKLRSGTQTSGADMLKVELVKRCGVLR